MKSFFRSQVAVLGLIAGLCVADGCSSSKGPLMFPTAGASGSSSGPGGVGTAGSTGAAGATGTAGIGAAGATSAAGTTGTAGAAGAGGASGTTGGGTAGAAGSGAAGGGTAGAAGTGAAGTGAAGATGTAGGTASDITKVLPSAGCGMTPGQADGLLVMHQLQTMGTKDATCADQRCGAWTFVRDYWVRLPTGYDKTKAYPLVFEGPGCGGQGNNLYVIPTFDATVIRVGLSPSKDAQAFHATNPGQGCFDDKEGDDSIEWVFYENLYDLLAGQLCFDRNRVFAAGNSSGAWLANELGCKYAGDATRPIRGVMPNTGGLPTDPKYVPTCTQKPLAGFWSYQIDDIGPIGNIVAINRALHVNGCTPAGVTYETGTFDAFPIGAGNAPLTCKTFQGCPEQFPLVVCPLPGNTHSSNDTVVAPGWPTFVNRFSVPPLLTP